MHVNFCVEALARYALECFIKTPITATNEYLDAVDRDGESVVA